MSDTPRRPDIIDAEFVVIKGPDQLPAFEEPEREPDWHELPLAVDPPTLTGWRMWLVEGFGGLLFGLLMLLVLVVTTVFVTPIGRSFAQWLAGGY